MKKSAQWITGWRGLRVTIGGIILYAILSWLTNVFPLATSIGVDIRPGIAVPIFFGFAFGPVVGFLTGTLGNFLGDIASGYVAYPPHHPTGVLLTDILRGFLVNWEVGNGLIGLIPGLAALYYRRYLSFRDQLRSLFFAATGILVGIGFASFTDILIDPGMTFHQAFSGEFIPATKIDVINAAIIMPIVLFNYARLDQASGTWLRSRLMRRIALAIVVSAALPVALLGLFLAQLETGTRLDIVELIVRLGLTVVATLIFAVANATLVALSIVRPLLRLTEAAQLMEAGTYSREQAAGLKAIPLSDEISMLSRVFGRMAEEVIQREASLRRQVQELQIEIDQVKKERAVAEITNTEYFESLQQRARELRARTKPAGQTT